MQYNIEPIIGLTTLSEAATDLVCPQCQFRFHKSIPPPRKPKNKHLWVDALKVLQKTNALGLAYAALTWANTLALAKHAEASKRGPKPTYSDASVMLTYLVAHLWHLSYEEILAWLANWPALAQALGYPCDPTTGQPRVISLGSYSKRLQALGLAPFFIFFVLVVRQLVWAGIISGRDLILDSTILRAWSKSDQWCAVSYKYRDINKRFGLKVHTLLDRASGLPVLFCTSPANAHDSPFALPLLKGAVALFGFKIAIFRADAAYDTYALWQYIVQVQHGIWAVDYNLRRRGKKFIASVAKMRAWRAFMGPRALIERWFGWTKRHFALKYFQVQGREAITRHVLATYIATLLVGWIATQLKRPDLSHSPSRVLAYYDA